MNRSRLAVTATLAVAGLMTLWTTSQTSFAQFGAEEPPPLYNEQEYNSREAAGAAGRTDVPRYRKDETQPAAKAQPVKQAAPKAQPVKQAAAPKAQPQTLSNETTLRDCLLQMVKRVPAKGALGQTLQANLELTPVANVADVVITDTIPAGTTYVKSEPAAVVDGRKLTWRYDTLDKGDTVTIKVWYKADTEGNLVNCVTMAAIARGCVITEIGRPALAIQKTGPEVAMLGSDVTYTIVVRNTGTSTAENVVVTDIVPNGLTAASGEKTITMNVGNLDAGQSVTKTVTLKAAKRGKFCNDATAVASNVEEVKSEACTVVVQPGLAVAKSGTKEQFLGRKATYNVVVSNTGDTDLKDVVVTDTAPAATTIVSASGATVKGNTATWKLGTLAKGAKETFPVVLTSMTPGTHCNAVSASAEGMTQSAQACTVWRGVPAVLIEVVDDPDPISVGDATTYTIRVTNQGTADDKNVQLVANFGKEIDPVSGSGATAVTVDGKVVNFGAVANLAPKQVVTWSVKVKGTATGDHRLKVKLTSDMLTSPVTEEESTHVY